MSVAQSKRGYSNNNGIGSNHTGMNNNDPYTEPNASPGDSSYHVRRVERPPGNQNQAGVHILYPGNRHWLNL